MEIFNLHCVNVSVFGRCLALQMLVCQLIWFYRWARFNQNLNLANPALRRQTSAAAERLNWASRRKYKTNKKRNKRNIKFIGSDVTPKKSPSQVSGESGDLIRREQEQTVKKGLSGSCIWICSDALEWATMVLVPAWLVIKRMMHLCSWAHSPHSDSCLSSGQSASREWKFSFPPCTLLCMCSFIRLCCGAKCTDLRERENHRVAQTVKNILLNILTAGELLFIVTPKATLSTLLIYVRSFLFDWRQKTGRYVLYEGMSLVSTAKQHLIFNQVF